LRSASDLLRVSLVAAVLGVMHDDGRTDGRRLHKIALNAIANELIVQDFAEGAATPKARASPHCTALPISHTHWQTL